MIIESAFTSYPAELKIPVFFDDNDSVTNEWVSIAAGFVETATGVGDGEDLLLDAADQADYLEDVFPHGEDHPWVYSIENGSQIFLSDSERMDLVTRGLDTSA